MSDELRKEVEKKAGSNDFISNEKFEIKKLLAYNSYAERIFLMKKIAEKITKLSMQYIEHFEKEISFGIRSSEWINVINELKSNIILRSNQSFHSHLGIYKEILYKHNITKSLREWLEKEDINISVQEIEKSIKVMPEEEEISKEWLGKCLEKCSNIQAITEEGRKIKKSLKKWIKNEIAIKDMQGWTEEAVETLQIPLTNSAIQFVTGITNIKPERLKELQSHLTSIETKQDTVLSSEAILSEAILDFVDQKTSRSKKYKALYYRDLESFSRSL